MGKIILDFAKIISYTLYEMFTETKKIKLTRGKTAMVCAIDYEGLNSFKWYALKAAVNFYAARTIKCKGKRTTQLMSRVLMSCVGGQQVHHKNGDSLDNRRSNLEICSQAENLYYRVRG